MQRLSERHDTASGAAARSATPVRYSLRQAADHPARHAEGAGRSRGGFARYQVLKRVFTLVASAEANRRMFVQAPRGYPRGRQYDNLALLIGRGLICAEGADWQRQRRLVQPVFDKALMARVVEITAAFTAQLVDGWDAARRRGDQVDLLADMQDLAMRVIGMALFGRDMRCDARTGTATADYFTEAVRSGTSVVFLRNISPVPLPLWLPTRLNRRFRGALAAVDRFVYERIDERLADRDGYDDILGELVRAYGGQAPQPGAEQLGPEQLRRELRDQAITLFFAGFETTAIALAWTWLLLSQNPDAEARFHDELGRVLGDRAAPPEDLKALAYTHQVVQESMRVYAPVYTLTRTAAADDQLGGHQVRRGDNIVIPIHALHHMERYWEEPAAFRPERFAPGRLTDDQRAAYLPFSFGQRRCLGATFATAEMVTVLAVAGQRVRLRHAAGRPVIPAGRHPASSRACG